MSTTDSQPPRRRAFKTGWLVSLAIHGVIIGLLAWFAAHEGMLGQPLQKISVRLLPPPAPEKPPKKPKLEPPPEKSISPPAPVPQKTVVPAPEKISAPPPSPISTIAAPAPMEMPALAFDDGGKTVQTEKDPAALYRSFIEFSLRSRWNRPADIADANFVALVEIAVDAAGRISDPRWRRKSGDARWDASVLDAIAQTSRLERPPPAGFPARATVRFDVVQTAEMNLE